MKAKTSVTIETLKKYLDELEAKFGKDARVAYAQVSYTQLSVARHYGGCKIQGQHFIYNADDDELTGCRDLSSPTNNKTRRVNVG